MFIRLILVVFLFSSCSIVTKTRYGNGLKWNVEIFQKAEKEKGFEENHAKRAKKKHLEKNENNDSIFLNKEVKEIVTVKNINLAKKSKQFFKKIGFFQTFKKLKQEFYTIKKNTKMATSKECLL